MRPQPDNRKLSAFKECLFSDLRITGYGGSVWESKHRC